MSYTAPTGLAGTPSGLNIPLTWAGSYLIGTGPALLMHFDGNFLDSSTSALTMTNNGATIDTTNVLFGTGALTVSAAGSQYVSTPVVPAGPIDLSTGDWTVECFVRLAIINPGVNPTLILGTEDFSTNNASPNITASNVGATLVVQSNIFGNTSLVGTITPNVYTHIALTRNNNLMFLWINGVQSGTPAVSIAPLVMGASPLFIGNFQSGNTSTGGDIDEVCITKGMAKYTGPFTPPSAPFATGGTEAPGYDVYRDGVSIATFTGPASTGFTDTVPSSGVYTYTVAGWQSGVGDLSALSAPYTVAIGQVTGIEAKFVPASVYKAIMVANPGSINPRIYPPLEDNTVRVTP